MTIVDNRCRHRRQEDARAETNELLTTLLEPSLSLSLSLSPFARARLNESDARNGAGDLHSSAGCRLTR
jgi:hypothetical protein